MKCPACGTEMKPLATSMYCPNDCDRIPSEIEIEKTPRLIYPMSPTKTINFIDIGYDPDPVGPPDPPDQSGQLDWLDVLNDVLDGTD